MKHFNYEFACRFLALPSHKFEKICTTAAMKIFTNEKWNISEIVNFILYYRFLVYYIVVHHK